MQNKFLFFCLILLSVAGPISAASSTEVIRNGVARKLIAKEALPNIPGHILTAVTVQLNPGKIAAPHKHDAFVFVYLLEGRVRSQLGGDAPVDYTAGDSWTEPPGSLHTMTQNLSKTEFAKLLAVFVSKKGAKLTTSGSIGD